MEDQFDEMPVGEMAVAAAEGSASWFGEMSVVLGDEQEMMGGGEMDTWPGDNQPMPEGGEMESRAVDEQSMPGEWAMDPYLDVDMSAASEKAAVELPGIWKLVLVQKSPENSGY